jgi:hypothetical protein
MGGLSDWISHQLSVTPTDVEEVQKLHKCIKGIKFIFVFRKPLEEETAI